MMKHGEEASKRQMYYTLRQQGSTDVNNSMKGGVIPTNKAYNGNEAKMEY